MPRIWSETIAAHKDAVRDAALDATAVLVAERGLTGVTMSAIASASGIGRATLYKYFPDLDAVLAAWHERLVGEHLARLTAAGEAAAPAERLGTVLRTYAALSRHRGHDGHDGDAAAALHQGPHMAAAHAELVGYVGGLISAGAGRGEVRDDVPPEELAAYCLHALTASALLPSTAAVERLVDVTLAGMGIRGVAEAR
jgi:AcrR family transcriptional regulator